MPELNSQQPRDAGLLLNHCRVLTSASVALRPSRRLPIAQTSARIPGSTCSVSFRQGESQKLTKEPPPLEPALDKPSDPPLDPFCHARLPWSRPLRKNSHEPWARICSPGTDVSSGHARAATIVRRILRLLGGARARQLSVLFLQSQRRPQASDIPCLCRGRGSRIRSVSRLHDPRRSTNRRSRSSHDCAHLLLEYPNDAVLRSVRPNSHPATVVYATWVLSSLRRALALSP